MTVKALAVATVIALTGLGGTEANAAALKLEKPATADGGIAIETIRLNRHSPHP